MPNFSFLRKHVLSQWRALSRCERLLVVLCICTLPLVNPWVRGDGVGYYAYARALLIDHDLRFEKDWLAANESFRMNRVNTEGRLTAEQYTSTGYIDNHFAIGPAIDWAPFLIPTHTAVLALNRLGARIPADGFSRPYRMAMALGTAFYGFAGLFLSFRLARSFFEERWAFWSTLGIWFASSLPVYMYLNPSWSHAHSAFAGALFLWYWHRTRRTRTMPQWALLGLIAGLMLDVYYIHAVLLLVVLLESLGGYRRALQGREERGSTLWRLFSANLVFALALVLAFLPTLITKKIIYGHPLSFGYGENWFWGSPALWSVLFSSNHGLFVWTPVVLLAVAGLFCMMKYDREFAAMLLVTFGAFCYVIASYENWHGIASFGNRFFVSLTPVFVLGLAAAMDAAARRLRRERLAAGLVAASVGVLVLWNAGFIFQWGTHRVPARGPVSWREVAYNQVAVVPAGFLRTARSYLGARGSLMQEIEREDVERLKQPAGGSDKKR